MFETSIIGIFVTILYKESAADSVVSSESTFLFGISDNQSPALEGNSPPEAASIPVNCDPSP